MSINPNFPSCLASCSFWENYSDQWNTTNRCNVSAGRGLRKLHNEQWLVPCCDHYSCSAPSGKIKLWVSTNIAVIWRYIIFLLLYPVSPVAHIQFQNLQDIIPPELDR